MTRAVQIVDSIEYANSNCYQRQLLDGLQRATAGDVVTISLSDLQNFSRTIASADVVISCLKQRTLDAKRELVARALGGRSLVVYDQDPWEAWRIGAAGFGAYDRIASVIKVDRFAVTTHAWVERIKRLGHNSSYVPMGILPRFCKNSFGLDRRSTKVGFIGLVHNYRKELFSALESAGIDVKVIPGGLSHDAYLEALRDIAVYVHREEYEYEVPGERVQYAEGLWVKDVEAAAQGCISIRNFHSDYDKNMPAELVGKSVRMYDDVEYAVALVRSALDELLDLDLRKEIAHCVDLIKRDDAWFRAATELIHT